MVRLIDLSLLQYKNFMLSNEVLLVVSIIHIYIEIDGKVKKFRVSVGH